MRNIILLVGFVLAVGCGRRESAAEVGDCGDAASDDAVDTAFDEVREEISLTCEDLQEIDRVVISEGSAYTWTGYIDVDGDPWGASCDFALGDQDWSACEQVWVSESSVAISVRCPGGDDDADMRVRIRWWGEG